MPFGYHDFIKKKNGVSVTYSGPPPPYLNRVKASETTAYSAGAHTVHYSVKNLLMMVS